jgi:hypothetical protein
MRSPVIKYIRKNIYRLHRISSMIVAIPILLWTISGFLHPVMGRFKPSVASQLAGTSAPDTLAFRISLKEALLKNGIDSIQNFRIVSMDKKWYWQVRRPSCDTLTYLDAGDGNILSNGDRSYAVWLAKRYLTEKPAKNSGGGHSHGMDADASRVFSSDEKKKPEVLQVKNVSLVTGFNGEYKSSNVLLPVYRVAFERKDDIRLYIETSTDRLATAIDRNKAWFTSFFGIAHTWNFMDGMGMMRSVLIGLFSALAFFTSLFGFYIHRISNRKKKPAKMTASKKWHRSLGIIFLTTTLLYAASGSWHAFHTAGREKSLRDFYDRSVFSAGELDFHFSEITALTGKETPLKNFSVVRMNDKTYWQVSVAKGKEKLRRYFEKGNLKELPSGDVLYGCYLACRLGGLSPHSIKHTACVNSFNNSYSMMNKRLPVVEVGFEGNENYYVETATGHLAAITGSADKAERFSFNQLHMHHYWESLLGKDMGKSVRDLVLEASTLGLILVALTGTVIFLRRKKKIEGRAILSGKEMRI